MTNKRKNKRFKRYQKVKNHQTEYVDYLVEEAYLKWLKRRSERWWYF